MRPRWITASFAYSEAVKAALDAKTAARDALRVGDLSLAVFQAAATARELGRARALLPLVRLDDEERPLHERSLERQEEQHAEVLEGLRSRIAARIPYVAAKAAKEKP